MKWHRQTTDRNIEDAERAIEVSNRKFAEAVHVAKKNDDAARRIQHERIANHIGPSVAAEIGRLRWTP